MIDWCGCLSQLKDLKRQLHLERKRADKLQERLQEILTNSKTRTGDVTVVMFHIIIIIFNSFVQIIIIIIISRSSSSSIIMLGHLREKKKKNFLRDVWKCQRSDKRTGNNLEKICVRACVRRFSDFSV